MVRSVLFLEPVHGDCTAIRRFFEDERVLQPSCRIRGSLEAEVQLPTDGKGPALVTTLWTSPEAYRTWVEDPWRAANAVRGAAVFEAVERPGGGGALYEVAIAIVLPGDATEGGGR